MQEYAQDIMQEKCKQFSECLSTIISAHNVYRYGYTLRENKGYSKLWTLVSFAGWKGSSITGATEVE